MEDFIRRLDTLLDNDPFGDIDENLLSTNDLQVSESASSLYLFELENSSFSWWKNIARNMSENVNAFEMRERRKQ